MLDKRPWKNLAPDFLRKVLHYTLSICEVTVSWLLLNQQKHTNSVFCLNWRHQVNQSLSLAHIFHWNGGLPLLPLRIPRWNISKLEYFHPLRWHGTATLTHIAYLSVFPKKYSFLALSKVATAGKSVSTLYFQTAIAVDFNTSYKINVGTTSKSWAPTAKPKMGCCESFFIYEDISACPHSLKETELTRFLRAMMSTFLYKFLASLFSRFANRIILFSFKLSNPYESPCLKLCLISNGLRRVSAILMQLSVLLSYISIAGIANLDIVA